MLGASSRPDLRSRNFLISAGTIRTSRIVCGGMRFSPIYHPNSTWLNPKEHYPLLSAVVGTGAGGSVQLLLSSAADAYARGHGWEISRTYEEFGGRQLICGLDTRGLVGSCLWTKSFSLWMRLRIF